MHGHQRWSNEPKNIIIQSRINKCLLQCLDKFCIMFRLSLASAIRCATRMLNTGRGNLSSFFLRTRGSRSCLSTLNAMQSCTIPEWTQVETAPLTHLMTCTNWSWTSSSTKCSICRFAGFSLMVWWSLLAACSTSCYFIYTYITLWFTIWGIKIWRFKNIM